MLRIKGEREGAPIFLPPIPPSKTGCSLSELSPCHILSLSSSCQVIMSTQWQKYFYAPCAWDVIRWSLSETNAPCAWGGPRFDALPHLPRVVLGQSPPRCRYIYVTFGFYHSALCVTEWKFCESWVKVWYNSRMRTPCGTLGEWGEISSPASWGCPYIHCQKLSPSLRMRIESEWMRFIVLQVLHYSSHFFGG